VTTGLEHRRVAFVVANEGIEQAELVDPWNAIVDAGGRPELIATEAGAARAYHHLDPGDTFTVDRTTADADPERYDGLVLPGGVANADRLRTDPDAVAFVRALAARAPVAVICHGPWILVAGAHWVDEQVHVDGALVSSRKPDDLPAFCEQMVRAFARAEPAVPESVGAST